MGRWKKMGDPTNWIRKEGGLHRGGEGVLIRDVSLDEDSRRLWGLGLVVCLCRKKMGGWAGGKRKRGRSLVAVCHKPDGTGREITDVS